MSIYAGFWRRAGAFALDYIIILFYLAVLGILTLLLNTPFRVNHWIFSITQGLFATRVSAQLTGFLIVTLPISLYFAVSESSRRQGTWGKQKLSLKVTDRVGRRVPFWRALGRTILKFVPWEISHTLIWELYFSPQANSAWINYGFVVVYLLIGLNMLSLIITKTRQTLYDLLTNTYVISSR